MSLQIGTTPAIKYTSPGGIITNPDGGVILNRKWNVAPTTQPTGNVTVKYFFTHLEYNAITDSLATVGTYITSPQDLEMYKLNSGIFADPHATGMVGTLIANGTSTSLYSWVYSAQGGNHSAEFNVNSFSGGGGGAGAGGFSLPVKISYFTAVPLSNSTASIDWATTSENNSSHFEIQKSTNGASWTSIGSLKSKANSTGLNQYHFYR